MTRSQAPSGAQSDPLDPKAVLPRMSAYVVDVPGILDADHRLFRTIAEFSDTARDAAPDASRIPVVRKVFVCRRFGR